jgi:hypothetical protein
MGETEKYLTKGFEVLRGKEILHKLEKEGRYVFHGSARELSVLEPRQSLNKNDQSGKMEPHGEPAVCATPFADIAIFRSMANRRHCPK